MCCGCFEPHEPALLSHIRSRWSGPPESKLVSLVSHLFPTVSKYAVGALGRIILHLYRTCLWMLWAAWFCVCTPLVSHLFLTLRVLRATCDSALVSPFLPHLSPGCPPLDSHCLEVRCGCSGPHESTLVSRAVGALSNLHLSPSCLPLLGSALDQLSPSWVPGSPLSKKGVDALDLLILDLCCRRSWPE